MTASALKEALYKPLSLVLGRKNLQLEIDPSRVYAFRKFVQALLIPAGVVDMAALARRPAIPPRDVDAVRELLKSKDYTQEQGRVSD